MWHKIGPSTRDWGSFAKGAGAPTSLGDRLKKRMDLVIAIREKLKEYRDALIMESTILLLRRPSRQAHDAFIRRFWDERNGERTIPTLDGYSESLYEDRKDLLVLKRAESEDRLTQLLRKFCPRLFKIGRRQNGGSDIEYISAHRISMVVNVITVLLAATLLFGAIYNLYYVQRGISLISSAPRAEIFGACAAYAAVPVVFLSGNLGNTGDSG
ncbi:uncharacterized protein Z518_07184 [Rhinocladiella mackenziei CBS 650.93]|uniref:Rhinocladiella mackenziei CBS 650.93 unplaced genomic scaffold supercont1.5, whole genome shotgun sequence n=1 Tax=Rhinocladiella mackenziei CBS 650.93 TaxID=1442369 RepID=A0A0D2IK68_9EURO|nr:uncharacterized protein Z518_07184 [Rhinocladiella mackenziei CBS 650.93]KIX03631.1 hypothetical protein Z518_07184 [Rhinocladiella mackenziei CBS 650.93]